ncbi:hypothetical protein CHUAL_004394 [Chamberlinius hualienensis]
MASLLGTLHFWTSKETLLNVDSNIGIYNYHGKNSHGNQQQFLLSSTNYNEEFKSFCEERGINWYLTNKRPEKLKENMKEVEELFAAYRSVYCDWKSKNVLLMMLNNGAIIKIWIKAGLGDVEKIRVDKYLVGKLISDHVVDVIFFDMMILISYVEAKLTIIHLNKKFMIKENSSMQFEKLTSLDPKLMSVELNGPNRRRFERKLSSSIQNDQLMVWWMTKNEEMPGPWAPPSSDREKANIHIYNITKNELQLMCYTRTKGDPVWASFSRLHLNQIYTIEQSVADGENTVTLCSYDIMKTKLQRTSVTTIPLSSMVICCGVNVTEDRTLLGCKDGSLVMYDANKRTTQITAKGSFIPTVIAWHPSGAVVMVGSEKGNLQCYDMALSVLNMELLSDTPSPLKIIDLSSYFKTSVLVQKLLWNLLEYSPVDCCGFIDNSHSLFIQIQRGPIGLFVVEGGSQNRGTLTAMELVTQYVKFSQFDEAINLLLSINWNIESDLCFKCITHIVVSLLKLPFTDTTEIQLESALGSYYSASYALSEVVNLEYHHKMTCLARRFFHHLLRNDRFEKAFLLAVDIGARDLFMDIHYVAKDKNEKVLSQAALERARQLETGSDSSSYDSDSGSYSSTCSSSSSGSCFSHIDNQIRVEKWQHKNQSYEWQHQQSHQMQQQYQPMMHSNPAPIQTQSHWAVQSSSRSPSSTPVSCSSVQTTQHQTSNNNKPNITYTRARYVRLCYFIFV